LPRHNGTMVAYHPAHGLAPTDIATPHPVLAAHRVAADVASMRITNSRRLLGMALTRDLLLEHLVDEVSRLRRRPTLVAIDGRSAAGKTTLADDLAGLLRTKGHVALRSSIDDFHPAGHKFRSRTRPYTPATYYAEGFDYAAFQRLVLDPLQDGGDRRCRFALWDSFRDVPLPELWTEVPLDGIVVIDGVFLFRPEFRRYWHYSIWLHIDWETMIARAKERDIAWAASVDAVINSYRTFWVPIHTLYETEAKPQHFARVVVDNSDIAKPSITRGAALQA
jgi:uridine kinase